MAKPFAVLFNENIDEVPGLSISNSGIPVNHDPNAAVVLSYHGMILSLKPEAYWRLDEANGPTIGDSSGNGHNGTQSGTVTFNRPSIVNDNGASVQFGTDQTGLITIPYVSSLAPTGNFTIIAWVDSLSRVNNGNKDCSVFYIQAATNTFITGFDIYDEGDNTNFGVEALNSGGNMFVDGIPYGTKHMIVLRRSTSTGHMVMKIDDIVVGDVANSAPSGTASRCTVGADFSGSYVDNFMCDLDEVAYWPSTALTDSQLTDLWNLGKP